MDLNIASALIAGGTAVVTLFGNEFFHFIRERKMREERFFNDFFPVRIQKNEKIMGAIAELHLHDSVPKSGTQFGVFSEYEKAVGVIDSLFSESLLLGSTRTLDILSNIAKYLTSCCDTVLGVKDSELATTTEMVRIGYYALYCELLEALRKESGVKLIDNHFFELNKAVLGKKSKKKPNKRAEHKNR